MDNPGLMVSRLLQVAMSDPQGPVYMTVPREVAMQPMPGSTRFPTRDQLGIARPAWPDPRDAKTAAEWLVKANNPVICLAKSGRHPGSVEALVRLAELLGLPVRETQTDKMNFPNTHPLYGTGPDVKDADVVLVAESPAPFTPGRSAPSADAKIIWVDPDPVQSRYKTMEYRADMWLPVSVTGAAEAIYEAATGMLTKSDMDRIADRRARLEQRKAEIHQRNEDLAAEASKRASAAPPLGGLPAWPGDGARRHPAGRRPQQHAPSCRRTTGGRSRARTSRAAAARGDGAARRPSGRSWQSPTAMSCLPRATATSCSARRWRDCGRPGTTARPTWRSCL